MIEEVQAVQEELLQIDIDKMTREEAIEAHNKLKMMRAQGTRASKARTQKKAKGTRKKKASKVEELVEYDDVGVQL